MRMSGMTVLRGEAVEAGGIVVEGVDDGDHLTEDKWGLTRSETLIVNTKSRFRDKFILLLRHRPVVEIGTEASSTCSFRATRTAGRSSRCSRRASSYADIRAA